jgi:hypothetical protein
MIILAIFTELASSSALVEVALFATSTLALRATIVAAATATNFWCDILASSFQFLQEIWASASCTSPLLSAAWISALMAVLVATPELPRSFPTGLLRSGSEGPLCSTLPPFQFILFFLLG